MLCCAVLCYLVHMLRRQGCVVLVKTTSASAHRPSNNTRICMQVSRVSVLCNSRARGMEMNEITKLLRSTRKIYKLFKSSLLETSTEPKSLSAFKTKFVQLWAVYTCHA